MGALVSDMAAAFNTTGNRNEEAPPARWAVDSGRDEYGAWATFEVGGARQRMRWIPAGTFLMGSPDTEVGRYAEEGPQHEVTLTHGYWLADTSVTQALWIAVMGKNPSVFQDDLLQPVENVSWDDCQEFIERINAQVAGLAARLPTEAEWERACRGGTQGATWVGELSGEETSPNLDGIAWYAMDWHEPQTHPVAQLQANPYGLYDMLGNVWEWCADGMREYSSASVEDPVGQGTSRVYRGGSWYANARGVRAADRLAYGRGSRNDGLGFRLAGGQAAPR
jgi:formylglycine-generating enzyme